MGGWVGGWVLLLYLLRIYVCLVCRVSPPMGCSLQFGTVCSWRLPPVFCLQPPARTSMFWLPACLPACLQVELMEIVDFFQKPERFRESGSRIPRGVLLCGPPGTGKTLLGGRAGRCARAQQGLPACLWI